MFLYVANWKMNMPYQTALEFSERHYEAFITITENSSKKIVICPSFPVIKPLCELFEGSTVAIGGQDCSFASVGSYTGQVAAQALKDVGCSYCIVGHSETRRYLSDSNEQIAQKVVNLFEVGIEPILCVGETRTSYEEGATQEVLKVQLETVLKALVRLGDQKARLCIAYEPVWAIGSGEVPTSSYIESVLNYIIKITSRVAPGIQLTLLYGGSVNENTAGLVKSVRHIEGFLIGGASLDFQKFEKIVNL